VAPADETRSSDDTSPSDDGVGESGPRVVRIGTSLGRYLLGEVLGHGAMATVFRARDRQLGRTVAIKVMNLAVAARSDADERFRREAQAVAALRHPGIVEIYDFCPATADEPAYIVAELISGPTLSALLSSGRGRLLPEVAVLIGAEVADALAAAHERGIVHRDIKPDNVMVEKTATASRVVLTDFGVAHVTGLETMTATGALVGSPAYMSPEQARGQDVGWATDVWAVGVLLYQMITGVLPFPGREPFAVIAAISRGDFRRPSQVHTAVSTELEQIVMRCLAPDPARRGASARALAGELRALARQAGFEDGPTALRAFLDDADRFEAELRPRVADAAVERARRHLRRGELAKALTQVGRATAYVPDHHGAAAVVRSVSARRRWVRVSLAALALGAVVVASYGGAILRNRWLAARAARSVRPPSATALTAPPAPPGPVPASVTPTPLPAARLTASTRPTGKRGAHRKVRADQPAVDTLLRSGPGARPAEAEPERGPPVEEPVPPPPPAPAPGRVRLMASRAFCFPSLDDTPVSKQSPAVYPRVAAGKHRVYCDGKLVGEIDVPPGGDVEKTIRPGPDRKPVF